MHFFMAIVFDKDSAILPQHNETSLNMEEKKEKKIQCCTGYKAIRITVLLRIWIVCLFYYSSGCVSGLTDDNSEWEI